MRVFVCSPLRGPDGQPSPRNIELARRLMRAVFEAGCHPFVPHLLYPQVLTESPSHLKMAFDANFAWLSVSSEIWVYARTLEECSSGMRKEVLWVPPALPSGHFRPDYPRVVWMPPPFAEVEQTMKKYDGEHGVAVGQCSRCGAVNTINRAGECLPCFSRGTPTP